MTSPKAVLKSVGPKLVPFFKTVSIYFVLMLPDDQPSTLACLIKCLPILSLCVFVLLHGMSLSDEYAYSRRILTGLIFSALGDALLQYKSLGYFIPGMFMFGIAQVMYGTAFGMHPKNPYAGSVLGFFGILVYYYLYPGLQGEMVWMVPIYMILIFFMAWRAIARVQFFDDLWTWTKLCGCAGAIFFVLSDSMIGIEMFCFHFPYSQQLVMITYYAAQLGIALSVVDSRASATVVAHQKQQ